MNRSEQEHLYRQSRQVSVVRSSPALRAAGSSDLEDTHDRITDDLLLNVLHSPVTRDQRRKSSSVLLKPPLLYPGRRASTRSALDAELPFIDAQAATVAVEERDSVDVDPGDVDDAPDLDSSPRYWPPKLNMRALLSSLSEMAPVKILLLS